VGHPGERGSPGIGADFSLTDFDWYSRLFLRAPGFGSGEKQM
jgi:hypothetical protein